MSNRLYSSLKTSTSARYYFALNDAPGVVFPGVATLTILGLSVALSDQSVAFRTPATAALTLSGLSLSSPSLLIPAPSALALSGKQAGLVTSLTISLPVPNPVETPEASYAPTLLTQLLVEPANATLTINSLELNLSQGGNIGFVSPGKATLTLSGLAPIIALQPQVGGLFIVGLEPTLSLNMIGTVTPDPASLMVVGPEPELNEPFQWIDDDPAPTATWIDD